MELTIEVPEKLIERAATLGVPVTTLVSQALDQIARDPIPPGFVPLGTSALTREQATAEIREIASRHTLNGISIKELIEEGRRL
jgi:hypothetical protein